MADDDDFGDLYGDAMYGGEEGDDDAADEQHKDTEESGESPDQSRRRGSIHSVHSSL